MKAAQMAPSHRMSRQKSSSLFSCSYFGTIRKKEVRPNEFPSDSFRAHCRAYLLPQHRGLRISVLPAPVALQYGVSDTISPCRNKRSICPPSRSTPARSAWSRLHGDSLQYKMVQMDRGSQTLLPGSHRPNHSNRCGSLRHTHRYLQDSRFIMFWACFSTGQMLF